MREYIEYLFHTSANLQTTLYKPGTVSPKRILLLVSGVRLMLCAATVTAQVAVLLPSVVVTVMVAVPVPWAVTAPSAAVATAASLVVHVTLLSVASAGESCCQWGNSKMIAPVARNVAIRAISQYISN